MRRSRNKIGRSHLISTGNPISEPSSTRLRNLGQRMYSSSPPPDREASSSAVQFILVVRLHSRPIPILRVPVMIFAAASTAVVVVVVDHLKNGLSLKPSVERKEKPKSPFKENGSKMDLGLGKIREKELKGEERVGNPKINEREERGVEESMHFLSGSFSSFLLWNCF